MQGRFCFYALLVLLLLIADSAGKKKKKTKKVTESQSAESENENPELPAAGTDKMNTTAPLDPPTRQREAGLDSVENQLRMTCISTTGHSEKEDVQGDVQQQVAPSKEAGGGKMESRSKATSEDSTLTLTTSDLGDVSVNPITTSMPPRQAQPLWSRSSLSAQEHAIREEAGYLQRVADYLLQIGPLLEEVYPIEGVTRIAQQMAGVTASRVAADNVSHSLDGSTVRPPVTDSLARVPPFQVPPSGPNWIPQVTLRNMIAAGPADEWGIQRQAIHVEEQINAGIIVATTQLSVQVRTTCSDLGKFWADQIRGGVPPDARTTLSHFRDRLAARLSDMPHTMCLQVMGFYGGFVATLRLEGFRSPYQVMSSNIMPTENLAFASLAVRVARERTDSSTLRLLDNEELDAPFDFQELNRMAGFNWNPYQHIADRVGRLYLHPVRMLTQRARDRTSESGRSREASGRRDASRGSQGRGAADRSAVSHGAASRGAVSHGAVSHGAASRGAVSHGVVSRGAVSHGAGQGAALRRSPRTQRKTTGQDTATSSSSRSRSGVRSRGEIEAERERICHEMMDVDEQLRRSTSRHSTRRDSGRGGNDRDDHHHRGESGSRRRRSRSTSSETQQERRAQKQGRGTGKDTSKKDRDDDAPGGKGSKDRPPKK